MRRGGRHMITQEQVDMAKLLVDKGLSVEVASKAVHLSDFSIYKLKKYNWNLDVMRKETRYESYKNADKRNVDKGTEKKDTPREVSYKHDNTDLLKRLDRIADAMELLADLWKPHIILRDVEDRGERIPELTEQLD